MQAVTGKSLTSSAGILRNYARRRLRGRVYPGILKCAHQSVHGRVYHAVDRHSLALLDSFEGDEYRRIRVNVRIAEGKRTVAYAYVIRSCYVKLLTVDDWDIEAFTKNDLKLYLAKFNV